MRFHDFRPGQRHYSLFSHQLPLPIPHSASASASPSPSPSTSTWPSPSHPASKAPQAGTAIHQQLQERLDGSQKIYLRSNHGTRFISCPHPVVPIATTTYLEVLSQDCHVTASDSQELPVASPAHERWWHCKASGSFYLKQQQVLVLPLQTSPGAAMDPIGVTHQIESEERQEERGK